MFWKFKKSQYYDELASSGLEISKLFLLLWYGDYWFFNPTSYRGFEGTPLESFYNYVTQNSKIVIYLPTMEMVYFVKELNDGKLTYLSK